MFINLKETTRKQGFNFTCLKLNYVNSYFMREATCIAVVFYHLNHNPIAGSIILMKSCVNKTKILRFLQIFFNSFC